MGNRFSGSSSSKKEAQEERSLPIHTVFKLPSPLPPWPSSSSSSSSSPGGGSGFGNGQIDLGGLQVCQISTFNPVWSAYDGGPDNLGTTIFQPSSLRDGYSVLGHYAQPNNEPLFGWVLVARDISPGGAILRQPRDYSLAWTSESSNISQTKPVYVWMPVPPEGYKAVGHVVTTSPEKPPVDRIMCVRADHTEECELETWVWSPGKSSSDPNGFNLHLLRPRNNRGTKGLGVSVGTFAAHNNNNIKTTTLSSLSCLKNINSTPFSSMPNLPQIEAIFREYSPMLYFHPKETYLPSSVNWFFANGAALYKRGDESNPVSVLPDGENLPQGGGSDDGAHWLDLPTGEPAREAVKKGDLESSEVYLHVKPMMGGTFADVVVWVFYPFNGPATAKVGPADVLLGRIGEHVGDWEHLTLRISNFDGIMYRMYFSAHSGGEWVDTRRLEFLDGAGNKPAAYASRKGHANYSRPGAVLQGLGDGVGLRNDTAKSGLVLDCGRKYAVVAGEGVAEPPWLNFAGKWGPVIRYAAGREAEAVKGELSGSLKAAFGKVVAVLPEEVYGEEGPTGPKWKDSWTGDEK